jgi:hypothetical protein
MLRANPAIRNVAASAVTLAIAIVVLVSNTRGRVERVDLDEVTGQLTEWSVVGRENPFLRFRLEGSVVDFRLDPLYFREALDRQAPREFQKGARVTIVASRAEIRSPTKPSLSNAEIVWVRGLEVEGRTVLDPRALERMDSSNDRWGYALLAFAVGALVYSLAKWRFPRKEKR